MHGDWGWGWIVTGWVWMLLFWGSIIGLVVWGLPRITRGQIESTSGPLEIAKTRYARGEITKEEFESIKRDIT